MRVYIDILQDIIQGYDNSYHRSIGLASTSLSQFTQYGSSEKKIVLEIMDET